jgi:hypothetical protein
VTILSQVTKSETKTVEGVLALLDSGKVHLTGSFRGCLPERQAPVLGFAIPLRD